MASQVTLHYDLNSYEDAPDHNAEETVPSTTDPKQVQRETAAILRMRSKQQHQTSLYLAEYCNSIIAELYLHPEIAQTICNKLRGVRALCSALNVWATNA